MNKIIDVAIIGGGPSGLMCGFQLRKYNIDYKIFERGKNFTERLQELTPYNIANGLGGCGLLSDGKYSFPPAASFLWNNADPSIMQKSYCNLKELMNETDIQIPDWNNDWIKPNKISDTRKKYTSIQATPCEQKKIVNSLVNDNLNILSKCIYI